MAELHRLDSRELNDDCTLLEFNRFVAICAASQHMVAANL